MKTDKSFTDEEARQILERAADRQETAERAKIESGDVSLEELKSIASEVGIDPEYVQAAASELVVRDGNAPIGSTLGLPKELRHTRVIPGAVSDAKWEQIVGVFRSTFGLPGIASDFGEVREWISTNSATDNMPLTIRLEPTEEGTLVTFTQPSRAIRQATAGVAGSFSVVVTLLAVLWGFGISNGPAIPLVTGLFALAAAGALGAGVIGGRHWVNRQNAKIEAAADKIDLLARSLSE
jgi:hypothetical protein